MLIAGYSGGGKTTQLLDPFYRHQGNHNPGVHRSNHNTRVGLARFLFNGNLWQLLHHIIIPDLGACLAGPKASAFNFLGFINSLCEDGITDIHTLNIAHLNLTRPAVIAIATTITFDSLELWALPMFQMGVLRRFLPISFTYTEEQDVSNKWVKGLGRLPSNPKIALDYSKSRSITTIGIPDEIAQVSIELGDKIQNSRFIATVTQRRQYDYGYIGVIRTLLMASAIEQGRNVVTYWDAERIVRLSQWMNFDGNSL